MFTAVAVAKSGTAHAVHEGRAVCGVKVANLTEMTGQAHVTCQRCNTFDKPKCIDAENASLAAGEAQAVETSEITVDLDSDYEDDTDEDQPEVTTSELTTDDSTDPRLDADDLARSFRLSAPMVGCLQQSDGLSCYPHDGMVTKGLRLRGLLDKDSKQLTIEGAIVAGWLRNRATRDNCESCGRVAEVLLHADDGSAVCERCA